MILTNKQEEAVRGAAAAYKAHKKCYVISGYAGSGKSTSVRAIIEALDIDEDFVCYATFTGKAAQVLQRKGNKNAMTLHKLLYESRPKPDGGFIHIPKPAIEYSVVVVDEVSMAPKELMDLLFRHRVFVICCGDPGQLPPVSEDADNHLLDKPDVFLDEIMRQAAESEIIRVSMDIREGRPLPVMNGNEVKIFNKNQLSTGMLTWADQILVGTNAKRKMINEQMRKMYGREGNPQDGDKLICMRNYWETFSENGEALVNGTIGILQNSYNTFFQLPNHYNPPIVDITAGNILMETGDTMAGLNMDKNMIMTGDKTLDKRTSYLLHKSHPELEPLEFEYGYAITTHKAQGSEWDKVLVVEEWFPKDREEHKRWLYTSVTRAVSRLVLIKA